MSEAADAAPATGAGGCFHPAAARAIAEYMVAANSDGSFCAQDAENCYLDVNLVISTNGKAGGRNSNLEAGTRTAGGRGLK